MQAGLDAATPHLAGRVLHFARTLRAAGLSLGTDRIETSLQALRLAGWGSREELRNVLAACLLDRREHQTLFDRAFDLFWGPEAMSLRPGSRERETAPADDADRWDEPMPASLQDAPARLASLAGSTFLRPAGGGLGASARERLLQADFARMDPSQHSASQRLMRSGSWPVAMVPTRRRRRATGSGRVDLRASLRSAVRTGGECLALRHSRPEHRPAPVLLLADVSRSMSAYAPALLQLAHGLARPGPGAKRRVESFVFGTRLTRITRWMRTRDPARALAQVTAAIRDGSAGTRIADSLAEFNRLWARRVLDSRSRVLLVTDGLEQGSPERLAFEVERLRRSCRRLLWGNPLLRYSGFQPRAAGPKAMLAQVHAMLPAHDLLSLRRLVQQLAAKSLDLSHSPPRTKPHPWN